MNKIKFAQGKFTAVSNELVYDSRITAKAKGIYLNLHSRPDGWQFFIKEIASHHKEPEGAIKSGIKELENAGYLQRKRVQGEGLSLIHI